ncbi:hypothetical protein KSW81_001286 [Nannochloris sp. 'desiccata']|nr:hypothetical protein KSW81_001286 [Chlorella desiccata (nom. nud.)]
MSTSQPKESELADKARTLNCSSSNPIVLGLDLAFTDQALENEFIKQHNRSQVFYDLLLALVYLLLNIHPSTTSLYSAAKVIASSTALHSKTDSTTPPTELSVERCIGSQAALQLIFGLWIPCWIAYGREVQARKSFLRSRRGDSAYSNAIFPSKWEMFMFALPAAAVTFPWWMLISSGTHLEY